MELFPKFTLVFAVVVVSLFFLSFSEAQCQRQPGPPTISRPRSPIRFASDKQLLNSIINKFKTLEAESENQQYKEQFQILENIHAYIAKFKIGRDLLVFSNPLVVEDVLFPSLNSSVAQIREIVCSIFIILSQKNPKVQIELAKHGIFAVVLQQLEYESIGIIQVELINVICTILWNNQRLQEYFGTFPGGYELILNYFSEDLRNTMIIEAIRPILNLYINILENGKTQKYDFSLINSALIESKWCFMLAEFLTNSVYLAIEIDDGFVDDYVWVTLKSINASLNYHYLCEDEINEVAHIFRKLVVFVEKKQTDPNIGVEERKMIILIVEQLKKIRKQIDTLKAKRNEF